MEGAWKVCNAIDRCPGVCSVNASHRTTTLQQYSAARQPLTLKPCVTKFVCMQAHDTWPHGTCLEGVQCVPARMACPHAPLRTCVPARARTRARCLRCRRRPELGACGSSRRTLHARDSRCLKGLQVHASTMFPAHILHHCHVLLQCVKLPCKVLHIFSVCLDSECLHHLLCLGQRACFQDLVLGVFHPMLVASS